MSLADALVAEFDHEAATTRRLLAIVPERDAAWKPHPKSSTLGELAMHIATILHWGSMTLDRSELDLQPAGAGPGKANDFTSTDALLRFFDENAAAARKAIAGASDAALAEPWTLRAGERVVFTMPRSVTLRSFVMNHLIHHRGQLSVYLRLRNVPLPRIYGPTADSV